MHILSSSILTTVIASLGTSARDWTVWHPPAGPEGAACRGSTNRIRSMYTNVYTNVLHGCQYNSLLAHEQWCAALSLPNNRQLFDKALVDRRVCARMIKVWLRAL